MSKIGFDLYWTDPPDSGAALQAARDRFEAAVKERDAFERGTPEHEAAQVRVMHAWDDVDAAQPEYFRLNIWGMDATCRAMDVFGMLCEPEPHSREEWDEVNELASKADSDEEQDEIYRRILSDHNGECPGIPWWKLGDNSGWYVLPGEIRPALHAYLTRRKQGIDPPPLEWWTDWIQWLGAAAEHGGFRVW